MYKYEKGSHEIKIFSSSVVDLWHFDTDPNPGIRTTELRIPILLFSSAADKMPTKNKFNF
jgi:hypothetical protein